MHWLYFADESPQQLEDAGFDYDSTWGYNDAVGYRAGTSQVFRLPGTKHLLELPLTIMDTALFYPGRMGLTARAGAARCAGESSPKRARFGGTLVVNWHDRSLAPERLWGRPYRGVAATSRTGDRAWFATAGRPSTGSGGGGPFGFDCGDADRSVTVGVPAPRIAVCPARRLIVQLASARLSTAGGRDAGVRSDSPKRPHVDCDTVRPARSRTVSSA